MPKTRDDFEPIVTGFLDDSDGAIIDAYFEPNPRPEYEQRAGTKTVGVTIVVDTPDLERPYEQWYSCGSADVWEIAKDGQELINIKKPNIRRFNKNSRVWDLVDAVAMAIGNGDRAKGQEVLIKRDKYMTEASFYTGWNLHWRRKPLPTVGGGTTDVPLPVTYLGEVVPGKREVPQAEAVAATADTSEVDKVITVMAPGKATTELKRAIMMAKRDGNYEGKPFIPTDTYIRDLISGDRLAKLEDEGKLVKDQDEKYL